jgi:hypothetical protein
MESSNYAVKFDSFAERYYIKAFAKKHKSNWDKTRDDIENMCKRIDMLLRISKADLINSVDEHKLVKLDFAIEGTKVGPSKSGNRCILHVNESLHLVSVLFVFTEGEHIDRPNITARWKKIIKDQFPDLGIIFSL